MYGLADDLDFVLQDAGVPVVYGGVQVYGIPREEEVEFEAEGSNISTPGRRHTLQLRDGALANLAIDAPISVDGRSFRILWIGPASSDGSRKLHLVPQVLPAASRATVRLTTPPPSLAGSGNQRFSGVGLLGAPALALSGTGDNGILAIRNVGDPLPAGATFTGPANRTYYDINGVLQSVGANVLRSGNYVGGQRAERIEGARSLFFVNGNAPVTQTNSLTATTYVLWMVGTGSITISAGTAVITAVGTATAGAPLVFVVTTAGTVTFTVTGSVTLAQCERGTSTPSSFFNVAVVGGARAADSFVLPFAPAPCSMTAYQKFIEQGAIAPNSNVFALGSTAGGSPFLVIQSVTGNYRATFFNGVGTAAIVIGATAIGDTVEFRVILDVDAFGITTLRLGMTRNGGAEVFGSSATLLALPATWGPTPLLSFGNSASGTTGGVADFVSPYKVVRGVKTLAQMRAFTTA